MKEITRYLKDVALLEGQLYTQDRLIEQLQHRSSYLGRKKNIQEPVVDMFYDVPNYGLVAMGAVVAGLCATGVLVLLLTFLLPDGFMLEHRKIRDFILLRLPIVLMITIFVVYIKWHSIKQKREYRKRYKWEMRNYQAAVQEDKRRIAREIPVKDALEEQINSILRERDATKRTLESLYSVGIIHPKYRNLVAVSSFFDYFDTGRCDVFTGRGGAYDTYEYECYLGRIETKLDVIISKLDEIIANQQYLGDLMREANSTLYRIEKQNDSMMKSMNRIQENTELTEYNTRCAAQSAAIMEHIAVYHVLKYD